MSWELMQGSSFVRLGYSINSGVRLKFTISEDLMAELRWTEETRLCLWVDKSLRLGRLLAVPKNGRKVRVIGAHGRAHCSFAWTEAEAKYYQERDGVYSLDVVEVENGGINFKLPGADGEEEG